MSGLYRLLAMGLRPTAVMAIAWAILLGATTTDAAPPGWNPTWSDEFEGDSLDTDKWDPIFWTTPHNNERQAYRPQQVTVENGNLVLTGIDTPFAGKQYTSGKVESTAAQLYGRWEVRAKLPGTQGTWPAIWLLPDTDVWVWPSQGEIDIMENRGNQPNLTSSAFHWGPHWPLNQHVHQEQQTTIKGQPANYHQDFHVYAVEWESHQLRFYVDDVHHYTVHDHNVGGALSALSAPMELNINLAIGGDFLGSAQPNASSVWPQQFLIDYVRVYERDENPPPKVFRNGGFEENGGSLAGWSTFGNRIPNNVAHNEAVLEGDTSAKLFGEFLGGMRYSGIQQGISVSPGDAIEATASAFVRSADSIFGTANVVEMKFDYFNVFGGEFGSSQYISSESVVIADGSTEEDTWHEFTLNGTAPANAVEARLSFVFMQVNNASGAVHIDQVSFVNLDLAFDADSDGDGQVDGHDFLNWQRGFGQSDGTSVAVGDFNYDGVVDGFDLEAWENQFGLNASELAAATMVPEPTGLATTLVMVMVKLILGSRCQQ